MDEKNLENLFLTLPPVWRMESRVPLPKKRHYLTNLYY